MDLGLRGRTAVVGGATSGLGRASADALAAEGCNLLIWSRRADALADAAAERLADLLEPQEVAPEAQAGLEVADVEDGVVELTLHADPCGAGPLSGAGAGSPMALN